MAVKQINKNSEEWKLFAEYWNLYKKYGTLGDNDAYWESVVNAFGTFGRKYTATSLAKNLAVAMVNTLAEEEKARANGKIFPKKDFGKDSLEWKIFAEGWNLYKEYGTPEDADSYWSNMMETFGAYHKKYDKETSLPRYFAMALIRTLDEEYKKERGECIS